MVCIYYNITKGLVIHMKILLGVNHEGIEEYVANLSDIDIIDNVRDKRSLLYSACNYDYDLAFIASELSGNEKIEDILEVIISNKSPGQRVAYLYGEYDDSCDEFIELLKRMGIHDFHIGAEVPASVIDTLIYKYPKQECTDNYSKSGKCRRESPYTRNTKPAGKTVLSILSNHTTGKSHTAWNLGYCFSKLGCTTSIINVDRGYSANLYWNIDEMYYDLLGFTIAQGKHKEILQSCFRVKNLNIITGSLGDENEVGSEDFMKILYAVRTQSDIAIIDTRTGISDITRQAIKNSVYDLLVFDCNIMHYHMNMLMIDQLREEFVPEKTIAVINNTNVKSSSHKFIYNELVNSGLPFKSILPISACGYFSSEIMHTNKTPYQHKDDRLKEFKKDMDNLLLELIPRYEASGKTVGIFMK